MRFILIIFSFCFLYNCKSDNKNKTVKKEEIVLATPKHVHIEKKFLYNEHTLSDTYPYKDTTRKFQWDKIQKFLILTDSIRQLKASWGILQNVKNMHGKAPLVAKYRKNDYNRTVDLYGVQQYQAIPLYKPDNLEVPERYGLDGSLVRIIKKDSTDFLLVWSVSLKGEWMVPKKYINKIEDTITFKKAVFVDRTNQNITTLEKDNDKWLVRSMNPTTTGLHKPPFEMETPLGIFVVQEKTPRMVFLKDGTDKIGGFAPYASRFSNGAYLHGVPVNLPHTAIVEFSSTLGTTPRSHMCVRNATSHAKFLYDWASIKETLVCVSD